MNPDVLLNRIRLSSADSSTFTKSCTRWSICCPYPTRCSLPKLPRVRHSSARKSTAHLRNMFFSVSNEPPIYYSPRQPRYDLLACRFIVPIGAAWPLRVLSFLKLTFLEGISWKITRRLFHVDARSSCEKKVIRLARQTPPPCAEIIKSIEMDIRRLKDGYDVLDKLYDDNDLNCDNFAQAVREYRCSREVITAVANLYLRQQIMLDTY